MNARGAFTNHLWNELESKLEIKIRIDCLL